MEESDREKRRAKLEELRSKRSASQKGAASEASADAEAKDEERKAKLLQMLKQRREQGSGGGQLRNAAGNNKAQAGGGRLRSAMAQRGGADSGGGAGGGERRAKLLQFLKQRRSQAGEGPARLGAQRGKEEPSAEQLRGQIKLLEQRLAKLEAQNPAPRREARPKAQEPSAAEPAARSEDRAKDPITAQRPAPKAEAEFGAHAGGEPGTPDPAIADKPKVKNGAATKKD